ncbi:MAG TPA: YihY/virulence factor BrkB family protein [Spirochaetia bacterium]|nr:YihY/virulence factor BrkB family protein [Spirochaetia bacterium]
MRVDARGRARAVLELSRDVLVGFRKDHCVMFAAGIAYFALVSIAPMLVIALGVTTIFVDPATGETELLTQIASVIGRDGADAIAAMIESARVAERSRTATIVGVAVLVFGATTLFAKLADSLNAVFGRPQEVRRPTIWRTTRNRVLSLTVVVGIGFLLLVSLIVDTAIVSLFDRIRTFLQERLALLLAIMQTVFSLGLSTALLGSLLKVMPARHLAWGDALAGGLLSSILFALTKVLFGLYLGSRDLTSSYGAAGTIVAVLLWVYAAALVLFLGAELAAARMARRRETEQPTDSART